MNWVLFKKIMRDLRWPLFLVGLLLIAFQLLWAKITQRIIAELLPELSKVMPLKNLANLIFKGSGKLLQALLGGDAMAFDKPMDMLTIGYVHPTVQVIFGIWAIGRAAGALAGEMDRGTMELLLAQPIKRRSIVLTQMAVDFVVIPVLCLCLISGTYLGVNAVELEGVDISAFWGALLNAAALMFALSGMTMAFSAAGRFRWRTLAAALGFALVMFIYNVLSQLWDVLAPWQWLNVFYYYQPQPIVLHDRWTVPIGKSFSLLGQEQAWFHVYGVVVLLGVGAIGYALALRIFTRRDLPAPL